MYFVLCYHMVILHFNVMSSVLDKIKYNLANRSKQSGEFFTIDMERVFFHF